MISLVSSSAKTSDFISPKDAKDQLLKTWDLFQIFLKKKIQNFKKIYILEDAYVSSKILKF